MNKMKMLKSVMKYRKDDYMKKYVELKIINFIMHF